MKHSVNVTQLIGLVGEAAGRPKEKYPILSDSLLDEQKRIIILGHSARHLSMSAGKMNGIIHDAEHEGRIYKREGDIKHQIFSTLFTLCVLCEQLNMDGDELVEGTEKLAHEYLKESEEKLLTTNS